MIAHFNLHLPGDIQCGESFFICLFVICISYLIRYLIRSLAHFNQFVFLLLYFENCLYILVNSLYLVSFLHIFSPNLWLVLSFSSLCLLQSIKLVLMKPSLSVISFIDHAFGVESKKSLPNTGSSRFSIILIVLHFTFRFVFFLSYFL